VADRFDARNPSHETLIQAQQKCGCSRAPGRRYRRWPVRGTRELRQPGRPAPALQRGDPRRRRQTSPLARTVQAIKPFPACRRPRSSRPGSRFRSAQNSIRTTDAGLMIPAGFGGVCPPSVLT
jgi:hypothetical protein